MKRWYLLVWIGFCFFALNTPLRLSAQPEYEVFEIREVVPFGELGFVAIFLDHPERPKRMRLEFFTPDNQSAFHQIVSMERQGIRAKYEGAFVWKGQLQILSSLYYPGPKRNHLLIQPYSVPDFQTKEGLIVDEAYTPELYRVPFGYSVSPDSSKIMFYSWSYTLPKDPARVTITVMDEALDTVWKQRYVLPYNNESLFIYNCRLTDDGRAFLLCENYTGKIGPVIDENKIEYFVLGAEQGEENMIIYDLNPAGKTLRGLHIDPAPGNAMAGAAFYQDPGKEVHLGLYVFNIPPGGEKMVQGFIPIEKEAYQAAYIYPGTDGILNANRHRFESYDVRKVDILPDGSMLVVAEQEYYVRADNIYEHNDILVMRVNPERTRLQWMHRLPKRQAESYNQGVFSPFSYKMLVNDGKWYFLFNDLANNHSTVGGPRSVNRYWGEDSAVIAAEISPSGRVRYYNLTRLMRDKSIAKIWTTHCWDLGEKELLVFGISPFVVSTNVLVGIDWEELRRQPSVEWNK